jgi:Tol biopolymer transport system component
MSTRSGNSDLWAMNANGSNQSNLTNDSVADDEPDWQPIQS